MSRLFQKSGSSHEQQVLQLPSRHMGLLLLSLAAVFAPHFLRLPAWITAVIILVCLWKYQANRLYWRQPGSLLRILVIGLCVIGTIVTYRTLLGRDAGISLLILMTCLKLLELRTRRDYMLIVYLGMFQVTTAFLFSQSIQLAIYMSGVLVMLVSCLHIINQANTRPLKSCLGTSLKFTLQALPLMLVFFVLFPRFEGPLWKLPRDAHSGKTGLSDSMTPGNISQLAKSDAIAFRVTFAGKRPPASRLYWRGIVLDTFNGTTWHHRPHFKQDSTRILFSGDIYTYRVTIEPHSKKWLFALDLPTRNPGSSTRINNQQQLLSIKAVNNRRIYEVQSRTSYHFEPTMDYRRQQRFTHIPGNSNPRTFRLARETAARLGSRKKIVEHWLQHFRKENFVYTLSPGRLGYDSIDEFMLDTRRGFCEHYAGAFAFIMRASGIPARVVTGYQGGEYNELGNYYIIRQSDAHAWTEIWLDNRGWVRIDPTSAVSPARIERGIEAALPQTAFEGRLFRTDMRWLRTLTLFWDNINNGWNEWVLGFNLQSQYKLLKMLGISNPDIGNLFFWLTAIIMALVFLLYFLLNRKKSLPVDPVSRQYRRYCNKLQKAGIECRPNEGPVDLLQRVSAARPDLADNARRITDLYVALRYRTDNTADMLPALSGRIRSFSAGKKKP